MSAHAHTHKHTHTCVLVGTLWLNVHGTLWAGARYGNAFQLG